MTNSTESKHRKYVKEYGFLWIAKKFRDKYGKIFIDTATKTGIDGVKTASELVAQKTPEATGDLIGNKIADKITSLGKTKSKKRRQKTRNLHTTRKKATNYW